MTAQDKLYSDFLELFPLDSLSRMTLEQYTNTSRDSSFCYWLEFRLSGFGGIRGGSAGKFSIYACNAPSKDSRMVTDGTYAWAKSLGKSNAEEAFLVVREAICEIAQAAARNDLEAIDQNRVLSSLVKWKIAFMYSQKRIVPILQDAMLTKVVTERGMPNAATASTAAKHYFLQKEVVGKEDVIAFSNKYFSAQEDATVDTILSREMLEKGVKVWMYSPGEQARLWDECKANEEMYLGWDDLPGSLEQYPSREAIVAGLQAAYHTQETYKNSSLALYEFYHVMKPGDAIIAKKGALGIVGLGIVQGDYFYEPSRSEYRHVRKVHWTLTGEWVAPHTSAQKTLTDISKYRSYVKDLKNMFQGDAPLASSPDGTAPMPKLIGSIRSLLQTKKNVILQGAPGTGKTYSTAAAALAILGIEGVNYSDHKAVMELYSKLQGDRIFFTTFHQSLDYEDFVEGLKPRVVTDAEGAAQGVSYEPEDGIFKRACSAVVTNEHKDIIECIDDYLQLIKGYNNRREIPTLSGKSSLLVWWSEGNKTISSRSTNSSSKRAEDHSPSPLNIEKVKLQALGKSSENNWPHYAEAFIEAVKREYHAIDDKPVVLIIDEINRGNVSKIFGELITLLEADKRLGSEHPIQVTLPYSKSLFGVPSNLYIIGTMNTTDRSTGTLDYALRRRFAFVTLKSDPSVIARFYDRLGETALKELALALFSDIENFIKSPKHSSSDFSFDDLMVGHSYFMASSQEELQRKIQYEVLPLIGEYINDGLLSVQRNEQQQAFEAWSTLRTIASLNNTDNNVLDNDEDD